MDATWYLLPHSILHSFQPKIISRCLPNFLGYSKCPEILNTLFRRSLFTPPLFQNTWSCVQLL